MALVLPLAQARAVTAGGPKAATLARLRRAGLPVPDGFCLAAEGYRAFLASASLTETARGVIRASEQQGGRLALKVRQGLLRAPLPASVEQCLLRAYARLAAELGPLVAVRSSALSEGAPTASFAGQLETMLGVASPEELLTAVRACWASLWSSRAVQYMRVHGLDPARTAVAVLVQRLVQARAAGGALSRTPDGRLVVTAAWGLGPAVGQGALVPDRYVLRRRGPVLECAELGPKTRLLTCAVAGGLRWQAVAPELVNTPCVSEAEALVLARLVLTAEAVLGVPVEIEWALDEGGFQLLQARPLGIEPPRVAPHPCSGPSWLRGQPAGVGWAVGPACVVRTEAELTRVGLGDVLVTKVPGPALSAILPRVVGVVAELGGSTSHLAALARERGIPAVLGVRDATRLIPDGCLVSVDGTQGAVYCLFAEMAMRLANCPMQSAHQIGSNAPGVEHSLRSK
jgi:pyruvate,water dikinase